MPVIVKEDLPLFIGDAREHLGAIEQGLLALEHGVDQPPDVALINDLFRGAHSIKGAAGTLGFPAVVDLTHHLENLLHAIRSGKHAVSAGAIEVLFDGFDRLGAQINALAAGNPPDGSHQDLFSRVEEMLEGPIHEAFRHEDLLTVGVDASWWPLISQKSGRALLNASRDHRFIYRVHLCLAACQRNAEGVLAHPLLDRLELFALPSARRHVVAPEGDVFDHEVEVLVITSAEPELFPIMLGDPPRALEALFTPESEPSALPWQDAFYALASLQAAMRRGHRAADFRREVPVLKEALVALKPHLPTSLRAFCYLQDFVPILATPAPQREVHGLLTGMFAQLLDELFAHATTAGELVLLEGHPDATALLAGIEGAWESGGRRVMVDCSTLDRLNGVAIEALASWAQRMRAAGGGLCLVHQGARRPWILSLLEAAGMRHALPLWPTRSAGLMAFGGLEEKLS